MPQLVVEFLCPITPTVLPWDKSHNQLPDLYVPSPLQCYLGTNHTISYQISMSHHPYSVTLGQITQSVTRSLCAITPTVLSWDKSHNQLPDLYVPSPLQCYLGTNHTISYQIAETQVPTKTQVESQLGLSSTHNTTQCCKRIEND